jgi:general L-amino acid transport system permease protein
VESGQLAARRPMQAPPVAARGAIGWLRENLFSSWSNGLVTIALLLALYAGARSGLGWVFGEANWEVVRRNLGVLTWGRYPQDQAWRLAASLAVLAGLGLATWLTWRTRRAARRALVVVWMLTPLLLLLLLRGLVLPTPRTVANHLGYYLFRPELLPLLGVQWRAYFALVLIGSVAGFGWNAAGRRGRVWVGLASAGVFGLLIPYGLQPGTPILGMALPNLVRVITVGAASWLFGRAVFRRLANFADIRRAVIPAWGLALVWATIVLTNFDVGVARVAPAAVLPIVEPAIWGGVLLTLALAAVSILASFPIGVLLALGRRSRLPVLRAFSVLFIEVVRGVPLITVLFMAQVMLPLFLPMDLTLDRVLRAMAGMTLFTAAYLAEIVRGGLQAVRPQQYEAARALGLGEVLVTGLVVLPQALRAVIPPIMGQFVSIFKDTTLVTIVGLLDLLAVAQSVIKQREFLGLVREVYLFAALFYFVLSYGMSRASRRIEQRLGIEQRAA